MALETKKQRRNEKVTPAQLDVEPLPTAGDEDTPTVPLVTALVYSYNNVEGLRRCLAALEASTARAIMEIVVVDKGSQDESPTLDTDFPSAHFLRMPRFFGNTKALNIGMRTGVGELVFFLSPEIEIAPDTIANLVARLEADQESVAVAPLIVDEHGKPVEQAFRLPTTQTGANLIPVVVPAGTSPVEVEYHPFQAMMARKYFIRGINYLDERFGEFGADAELCFQIRRAGRKVKVLSDLSVTRTPFPVKRSDSAATLFEADRVNGLAVYFGKHFGFVSGLSFRIGRILAALFSFKLPLLMELVSLSKIDGSQNAVL